MHATLIRPRPAAPATVPAGRFLDDVLHGLRLPRKELPCKYFYDAAGSRLFDQITELDEYYPTRTELAILQRHAADIASLLGRNCLLIEYGSGSSTKTRLLLDHLAEPAGYVPVDICGDYLRRSARRLARQYPHVDVRPLCADFTAPLALPDGLGPQARRVVYFPGSTIGNLTNAEAVPLLRQTAALCGPDGGLLLGADRKKNPRVLHAAYNDAAGVTADFNRNLLVRINRELAADFAVEQFDHYAFYNPGEGRVEMHLVSRRDQRVRVGGHEFFLNGGESIRTEYSHKYSLRDLGGLAAGGGFEVRRVWSDDAEAFSVLYLAVL